jgi:hypothetical protein
MIEIIEQLREHGSTKAKERILLEHCLNKDWLNYLVAVYNPYIKYNKTGDKNNLRDSLDNLRLCRSIDAGVSVKTINKVYKDIIPTWGVQKALDFKNFKDTARRQDKITFPCIAQIKYDGFSFTAVVEDAKPVQLYTSGGHPFLVEDSIFDDLDEGVYLGEMMGVGVAGKLGDRTKSGIQTTMRTNTAKGIKNWNKANFKIFEWLSLGEFYRGQARTSYEARWLMMMDNTLGLGADFEMADITADGKYCETQEELNIYYNECLEAGWEGVIIRHPNHKWHNDGKRDDMLVKRKGRATADLLCTAELEGDGKNKGFIGSLMLQDKAGRTVKVGSGLTNDMGELDRGNWGNFEGTVVEIAYEQILDTYIQPVILHHRPEKKITDID